jgi:hypothetical protein
VVWHYLLRVVTHFCRHRNLGAAFRAVPFEVEARAFETGGWGRPPDKRNEAGTPLAPRRGQGGAGRG